MSNALIIRQKAEMFDCRAEQAIDPTFKQHYREMAAHYRQALGGAPRLPRATRYCGPNSADMKFGELVGLANVGR
jgi:hypothetical protein